MYALVKWQGHIPGQRPRTALAYVVTTIYQKTKADILTPTGHSKYQRPRYIKPSQVVYKFNLGRCPTPAEVRAAKKTIPKEPE